MLVYDIAIRFIVWRRCYESYLFYGFCYLLSYSYYIFMYSNYILHLKPGLLAYVYNLFCNSWIVWIKFHRYYCVSIYEKDGVIFVTSLIVKIRYNNYKESLVYAYWLWMCYLKPSTTRCAFSGFWTIHVQSFAPWVFKVPILWKDRMQFNWSFNSCWC